MQFHGKLLLIQNSKYSYTTNFRHVENICGFLRETVIESQELRRHENEVIGYPQHPQAGGTDDLEPFFSLVHCYLGNVFSLRPRLHGTGST